MATQMVVPGKSTWEQCACWDVFMLIVIIDTLSSHQTVTELPELLDPAAAGSQVCNCSSRAELEVDPNDSFEF